MAAIDYRSLIREVPDFPKPGILFYDITTLLQEPTGFRMAIDSLALPFQNQGIEVVVGIESRGFIFGGALQTLLVTLGLLSLMMLGLGKLFPYKEEGGKEG